SVCCAGRLMGAALKKTDRLFNALGDPTRRAIVEKRVRGPSPVSKLAAPLEITITAVRQHLDVLEACGLVRTQKVGRVRTCTFETKGLAGLGHLIGEANSVWGQEREP